MKFFSIILALVITVKAKVNADIQAQSISENSAQQVSEDIVQFMPEEKEQTPPENNEKIIFESKVQSYPESVPIAPLMEKKPCVVQNDCKWYECCAYKFFSNESFCVPFRHRGQLCLIAPIYNEIYNGRFLVNCPCIWGLQCVAHKYEDNFGNRLPLNPRCQLPGYDEKPAKLWIYK